MSDTTKSEELLKRLADLNSNEQFAPFRPILDKLRPAVEVAKSDTDANLAYVEAVLSVLANLEEQRKQGADVPNLVERISGGFVQPDWLIGGDAKQGARDFIDKSKRYVVNIFNSSADELSLATRAETIPVPIVLAVMNQAEAATFMPSAKPSASAKNFAPLRKHLDKQCRGWLTHYGATSEDWRPFGNVTIKELVVQALQACPNIAHLPLAAQFHDLQTLDGPQQRGTLRRIRQKGCILVLDVISIRHPNLQRAFHQSMLDAYSKTSIVSIAPDQPSYDLASKLEISIKTKMEEMEFQRRATDVGDYGASEKMTDAARFSSWISTRVNTLELTTSEPKRGVPAYGRQRSG